MIVSIEETKLTVVDLSGIVPMVVAISKAAIGDLLGNCR